MAPTSDRKSAIKGVQAIIFDMDGVLVDSEPLHLLAYQKYLATFALTFKQEDNHNFLGMKDVVCAQHLIKQHRLELTVGEFVAQKEKVLHELFIEQLNVQPGVFKTLEKAQELKLPTAIASSATMPTIELVVELTKTSHYFGHLCSGDEVQNGKPKPDVFLLAAERLKVQPHECLVIEDSYNGVCAAKAAGMMCIAIPCQATRHQDFAHADLVLASMAEVKLEELIQPRSLA